MDLTTPLTYVKGVGPARAAFLEAKGLHTVEDLLYYAPFRYEDRSNVKPIRALAPGEMATVLANVRSTKVAGFQRKKLGLFEATFTDPSGSVLTAKWFHGAYLNDILSPGQKIALFGKVEFDSYSRGLSMMHPSSKFSPGMTKAIRHCIPDASSRFMRPPGRLRRASCVCCCTASLKRWSRSTTRCPGQSARS
ncbi:MAG: hypothetical protein WDO18_14415 [Acidobacteriota bacterium]